MNNSHQPNASMNVSVTSATRGTALIVVESCIFVLLIIAALVGNSLVCLAFYRNQSLRTVTNYFVLSLALTDLSMAVLVMPLSTASSIGNTWIAGDFGCKIYTFLVYPLAGISLITVMLLAINRYFRVVKPALYANIFSKKCSATMAVCVWITGIIISTVSLDILIVGYRRLASQPAYCIFSFAKAYAFLFRIAYIVCITVPSVVIVACYMRIYQTIHHHNSAAAPSSQVEHSAYGVEEAKITRKMTVIVVGFLLCWLPAMVLPYLAPVYFGETALKYFNCYNSFPLFASSVINPLVYAIMSRPFRKEFLKILRCQAS